MEASMFAVVFRRKKVGPFLLLFTIFVVSTLAGPRCSFSQSQPAGTGCPKLPRDASEQEQWVWDKICAGQNANLQFQYGGPASPNEAQGWPPQREVSQRFLVTILLQD